jgi:hypothetical protein
MAENTNDKLVIFLIQTANISFNNQSGILGSCSKEELYNLSKANDSKQSYQDFVGQANYQQATGGATSTNVKATQGSVHKWFTGHVRPR